MLQSEKGNQVTKTLYILFDKLLKIFEDKKRNKLVMQTVFFIKRKTYATESRRFADACMLFHNREKL